MPAKERLTQTISAWDVFARRLSRVVLDAKEETELRAKTEVYLGDSVDAKFLKKCGDKRPFDLIITSPPYGDSRTTVSYGDVSALCLGVVQHIKDVGVFHQPSRMLDDACLGGRREFRDEIDFSLRDYWAGGIKNEARSRTEQFLSDLACSCKALESVLAKKADLVFVVSRRSAGGRRLYIDEFLKDTFCGLGFRLTDAQTRRIQGKLTPNVVDSRGASKIKTRIPTMRDELVLSFKR